MPFVEDRAQESHDPRAIIGVNVPVVMPALHCALGLVEVLGLWHAERGANPRWKVVRQPASRGWTVPRPGHEGGF